MESLRSAHLSPFQSTLSVRRATLQLLQWVELEHISIHALREESDGNNQILRLRAIISIHALREESDTAITTSTTSASNFNPRSP